MINHLECHVVVYVDLSEEILNNKAGLTKQGNGIDITTSGSKIVSKKLKGRKREKREKEREKN